MGQPSLFNDCTKTSCCVSLLRTRQVHGCLFSASESLVTTVSMIQIRDLFGLPRYGGSVTLQCQWTITPDLVQRTGSDPIHLACRVRDAAGQLVVDNGPRSIALSIQGVDRPEFQVFVPLLLPSLPGQYTIEIDAVVEHKFWASWHGIQPTVMQVERLPNGDLVGIDPDSARRFDVVWPEALSDQVSQFSHPLYGAGDSERAVEIPWALSRYRGERRVLDVGYANAEPRYLSALEELRVPLLAGIDLARARVPGIRGVVADVRRPPFQPGSFELIIAISVIEHIGRDNKIYLGSDQRDQHETTGDFSAVSALGTLLTPGGRLLVTVPFGVAEDHGWFIQYDARRLERLADASGLSMAEAHFYRYDGAWGGPHTSEQLAGCRYGQGATAAAGVACLTFEQAPGPSRETPRHSEISSL
jgi:SAM-dependent methyltransferase